jgi:uncharacterized repeat protein (TIGR03803 family)
MPLPSLRRFPGPAGLLLAALFATAVVPALAQESNLISVARFGLASVENSPKNIRGDLLLASDGNFYVASFSGGSAGGGAVARITPGGTVTVLGSLTGNDGLGAQAYAKLIQASDGNLYGTTYLGGKDGRGTVFKQTLAGTLTTLYAFQGGKGEPMLPYAGLVQAPDGHLYGTTMRGGANDAGTVFRLTLSGELTVLHEFSGKDGQNPEGTLIIGGDGNLYGTTLIGGDNDRGVIYRIATGGSFTVLYSFPQLGEFNTSGLATNETGANPRASLLLAADGNYYGTAYQGGASGYGTVFRMTPAGSVSVVYSFGGTPRSGGYPLAGLVQDASGALYGTTERGGHVNTGSVFRLTTSGTYTLLHSFTGGIDDGQNPYATLLPLNGEFYGVSYNDGVSGYGAVFKLILPQAGVLPIQFSVAPAEIQTRGSATLTWSSPSATACTTGGAWNDTVGTSGSVVVTPVIAGYYSYTLTCTDGAGIVRNAYGRLVVRAPEQEPVDGGGGGGALSPWLLLLAGGLLSFRLKPSGEVR